MKKLALCALIAVAVSCASDKGNKSPQELLHDYKVEVAELNKKIKELESQIAVSDTAPSKNGVKVTVDVLDNKPFHHYFKVGGSANAEQKSYISPEMGGQIKQIHVIEGQRVKKGDLLVSLNASAIRSQIAELKMNLELATTVYEKQKELWDQGIGSEISFLETKTNKESLEQKLVTANAQLDMAIINAPFDGIVDKIIGKEGELSSPGYELVRMVNLRKIEVLADVAETYLGKIKKGDNVTVEFPSIHKTVQARIFRVGNIINPNNRSVEITVKIDNADESIKPNMVAVLELQDYENPSVISVPSMIVKSDVTGKSFLFIAEKDENGYVAKKVFVEPGNSYLDNTEILKGLQPGQKAIVEGFASVSSGVPLAIQSL